MYKVNKHADKHARSRKKNKRDKWHVTRVKSHMIRSLPASSPGGALWRRGGKRKESLQLRLWNLNCASNSPVAPPRLSCQISANQVNQREAETSANINKH